MKKTLTILLAALLTLVPVSWSANTIIRDFYNPLVPEAQKREMGSALYVGWAASALQLLGGRAALLLLPAARQLRANQDSLLGAALHRARHEHRHGLRPQGLRLMG